MITKRILSCLFIVAIFLFAFVGCGSSASPLGIVNSIEQFMDETQAPTTIAATTQKPTTIAPTPRPTTIAAALEVSGSNYVLNTNTMKFHIPSCGSAAKIHPENREDVVDTRENIIAKGFSPCGNCDP